MVASKCEACCSADWSACLDGGELAAFSACCCCRDRRTTGPAPFMLTVIEAGQMGAVSCAMMRALQGRLGIPQRGTDSPIMLLGLVNAEPQP